MQNQYSEKKDGKKIKLSENQDVSPTAATGTTKYPKGQRKKKMHHLQYKVGEQLRNLFIKYLRRYQVKIKHLLRELIVLNKITWVEKEHNI